MMILSLSNLIKDFPLQFSLFVYVFFFFLRGPTLLNTPLLPDAYVAREKKGTTQKEKEMEQKWED